MLHKEDLLHMIADHTEAEIRAMLCKWLDCAEPASTPPAASGPKPVAVADGEVKDDGFYFSVTLNGHAVTMHLDTGAFEMLLTQEVADALNLPNDGPLQIAGVTGSSDAYQSHVTVVLDTLDIQDVHCVVDPAYTGTPLFGFRFFIDHQYTVAVNPVTQTVTLYSAS